MMNEDKYFDNGIPTTEFFERRKKCQLRVLKHY